LFHPQLVPSPNEQSEPLDPSWFPHQTKNVITWGQMPSKKKYHTSLISQAVNGKIDMQEWQEAIASFIKKGNPI